MASRHDELARAALAEITSSTNVGAWVEDRDREDAPGVVDVVFASTQDGYAGWCWIVSVGEVDGAAPTVRELGQLPGDGSLLAPAWIPWSERLAEWEAQQAAAREAAGEDAESEDSDVETEDAADDLDADDEDADDDDLDEDEDEDEDDDEDDDDLDDDGPRSTHGGDIDGVDIDDLDA